jgi:hypothetical protein
MCKYIYICIGVVVRKQKKKKKPAAEEFFAFTSRRSRVPSPLFLQYTGWSEGSCDTLLHK